MVNPRARRSLGRQGIAELVDRCCRLAQQMAALLAKGAGVEILNEVVLNQVLGAFHAAGGRRCGSVYRPGDQARSGRRHLLAWRHYLARQARDANCGLQLVDD